MKTISKHLRSPAAIRAYLSLRGVRVRGARASARAVVPVALLTAAALLVFLTGPNSSRSATTDGDPYHAPTVVDTNPSPKIVETTITAEPATVDIGQGVQAHALTFNGSIPGPTFRVDVGDTVIVHFRNRLDEETGIHWHGVEVANPMDGTPLTQNQVKPGRTFRYEFKVTRPGIYWYHPHHHSSTNQVFKGMYGMIVVREQNLEQLPQVDELLPPSDRTLRAVLSDTTVCKAPGSNDAATYAPGLPHVSGGPLPDQGPPTPKDLCETHPVDAHGMPRAPFAAGDIPNIQQSDALANPTNEGQTVLTNGVNVGGRTGSPENPGVLVPGAKTFPVLGNQQVRLQLVNASTTRYMRLRLTTPSGVKSELQRIGGEGGLLDKSRIEGGQQGSFGYDTQFGFGEILLPPGGRADVLARMSKGLFSVGPPETGVYTLWTEDYLRSGGKFAGLPTVPVMHFQVSPPPTLELDGVLLRGTPIRPDFDPVETLPATLSKPLDPASFQPPKPGLASPQIGLTTGVGGFGIDGVHGAHDDGGDFMTAPHPASARYVQPGRTYTLSVANQSASRHPFHLHGFSIQPLVLTHPSSPDFFWDYREFVDTVDIPPGYTLRFNVRIDKRPFPGNADSTTGGEIGRWVMHCHIFSHAEDGMISELVVTGDALDDTNERPQMTVDNVDVTGFRGGTVTASGSYADPDGDPVSFLEPRDAATNEVIGNVTKDGTDHGRWTWTYQVGATDHDRHVKIRANDNDFDAAQMGFDLHVQDPAAPTPTPTPTPMPSGGESHTETTPHPTEHTADHTAPVIRGMRVKRLARGTRVRMRLSERARLTVTVRRRGHRVARVSRAGVRGRNTLKVRKRLRPGRYAVIARAVDAAGNHARPVKVRLRIRRR